MDKIRVDEELLGTTQIQLFEEVRQQVELEIVEELSGKLSEENWGYIFQDGTWG